MTEVRLVEDPAGCSLNVGMLPACVVVGLGGVMLGLAGVFAVAVVGAAWSDWRRSEGIDPWFTLSMGVAVLFWAGFGAFVIRWQMRYGHLPAVYRLDEARGVFARRGERSLRWLEWEVARIREVRIRDGRMLGLLLLIRIEGKRFPVAAVFGRRERDGVRAFARRVRECAASRAVTE